MVIVQFLKIGICVNAMRALAIKNSGVKEKKKRKMWAMKETLVNEMHEFVTFTLTVDGGMSALDVDGFFETKTIDDVVSCKYLGVEVSEAF